jgi:hypothetical protein
MNISIVKKCLNITGGTALGLEAEVHDGPNSSFYVRSWDKDGFASIVIERYTGPDLVLDMSSVKGNWLRRTVQFTFEGKPGKIYIYPMGWGKIVFE